jgi:Zn-dependent protease with chaperone function
VLRIAARHEPGSPSTLWLDHDEPMAFSLAGAPGVVVATEGLNRYLSHEQVDAVLVHERAHLAGHHHRIVAISDALATMAPFLPLFNRAPIAVRELVELAADATAVRACGPEVVRAALMGVEGNSAPGPALAMSRDAPTARLARLQHVGPPLSPPRRLLSCGLASVMAMLMPSIAALGALFLLAVVVCSQH